MVPLTGMHYGSTSQILRLLGARVGKRIFWPGVMPEFMEYVANHAKHALAVVLVNSTFDRWDLLEVQDDVTFGSRSVFTALNAKTAAPIVKSRIVFRDSG